MKKYIKVFLIFFVLCIVCMATSGCLGSSSQPSQLNYSVEIRNYGENIYFFKCPYFFRNGNSAIDYQVDAFGKSLAEFERQHPELEYVSQSPFAYGSGDTFGYYVFFREKDK